MKKKLNILYEDKHLIAVYKKEGLPTIKSNNHKFNLYSEVYEYLHKKNQRVFVVHRLDVDTSGIVLFAKSEKSKNLLQKDWENVYREYISIVHGITKEKDIIKSYIKETKTLYSFSCKGKDGKYAETHYERINYNEKYSMLKINIITGRKNQIRVHMKDNNTPIVGDKKYGIKDNFKNMFLLANKLNFIHPITKQKITLEIDIPDKYLNIFRN